MNTFEIYFDDLDRDVQEELLEYYGITDVHEQTNWDLEPIAIVYNDEGDDDE